MKTTATRREFSLQGLKLPDTNPQMTIEDVRGVPLQKLKRERCLASRRKRQEEVFNCRPCQSKH
jgi:hypothetical protein